MAAHARVGLDAFRADIAESQLQIFFDYWLGLFRSLGRPPLRTEIDPAEMKPILEFIMLLDHDAERHDYRVRLAGNSVRDSLKFELTGKRLGDAFAPKIAGPILARYDLVRTQRLPHYIEIARQRPDSRPYLFRRVLVPLEGDGLMSCGVVKSHVDHLDTSLIDMSDEMKVIRDYLVGLD